MKTPNFLKGLAVGIVALSIVFAATAGAQNVAKRFQGTVVADRFNGAILAIAGTDITSTATEVNYTDVTTAGTAQASKALILDASKGATGLELVDAGNYRKQNGTTFTTADPNPSRAILRGSGFFLVDTTANAVDLDYSDDADLEAADLGTEIVFLISAGGTNALTVTNGASGVVITTLNTLGTTCEDVGDSITCTGFALEKALCITTCAD